MKHTQLGVTFLEILSVIAIVGVLAAVSYPTYNRMQIESRRAEAQAAVVGLDALIAQYLTENNKYTFDADDLALAQFTAYDVTSVTPVLTKNELYRLTIVPDVGGYRVVATATVTGSLTDCTEPENEEIAQCPDTLCREIAMYNGVKESTDSLGVDADASTTQCW